jgi:hypothetical protein
MEPLMNKQHDNEDCDGLTFAETDPLEPLLDILEGLGIDLETAERNEKGWTNSIACPFTNHTGICELNGGNKHPKSASWNIDSLVFNCSGCKRKCRSLDEYKTLTSPIKPSPYRARAADAIDAVDVSTVRLEPAKPIVRPSLSPRDAALKAEVDRAKQLLLDLAAVLQRASNLM